MRQKPVNAEIKAKLNKAFAMMRRSYHLLALQNYKCCSSCAGAAAYADYIDPNPGKYKGVVFYHQQDNDGLRDRYKPGCYIRFDNTEGSPISVKQVGEIAHVCLLVAGLKVTWNGDPDIAVYVE
jgi:hypothetical protein